MNKEKSEGHRGRKRGVIHEYGHDCQKCQSVIKKPCFIFNGQPGSDL